MTIYAHSLPGRPTDEWEPLRDHLEVVGGTAAEFAGAFGWAEMARVAGRLHDLGKCSAEFQDYIRGERARGGDHSTAGARVAAGAYRGFLGRALALTIAGHHAGLADAESMEDRLDSAHPIPSFLGWEAHVGALPESGALAPSSTFRRPGSNHPLWKAEFTAAFLIRMVFSCLVDADFLETERFITSADGAPVPRGVDVDLDQLIQALRVFMADKVAKADNTPLNQLRAEILNHAIGKAQEAPGFFTLTVPTGGGKTLTSLSFALEHARAHGMRRVIYVIPFTSIIEQTVDVFRKALGERHAVLEHHASFDWEGAARAAADAQSGEDGGDEKDGFGRLRRAAENWDAPIVVTTAVQFFESLYANRTSACRKLHNLTDSVIVLDEAQTLPAHLLLPCMAALDELQRCYGATIVLCTATQPALRKQDGALVQKLGALETNLGLDIPDDRELAPRPREIYRELKRVEVKVLAEPVTNVALAERFAQARQMLCIVNTRAHARAVFELISDHEGAVHLSTLMCAAHRRRVLGELRERLKSGAPVRLVSTSLVEAGVDISFAEVWRATAGLDSIAQAAGRCNREGELLPTMGQVVVFEPAEGDAKLPKSLQAFQQAAKPVLRDHLDKLGLDAVADYFRHLYFQKGTDALDALRVMGQPGVLAAIREGGPGCRFPFASLGQAFRLIDDVMEPVIVPWDDSRQILHRLATTERPLRDDLRSLQQYVVGIPKKACGDWLAQGVIAPVRRDLGDTLLRFQDLAHYRPDMGVNLAEATYRDAGTNVM